MNLNDYAAACHKANIKWWQNPATGEVIERNFGEMIALCHSELSEALEGHRKDLMDEKLNRSRDGVPGNTETDAELREKMELELADGYCYLDLLCQSLGVNLGEVVERKFQMVSEKMGYDESATRLSPPRGLGCAPHDGKAVHAHSDGTWWFWDETWCQENGPYGSEREVEIACTMYAKCL